MLFNLNASIMKKGNYIKLMQNIVECSEYNLPINFCNLASLCSKFEIEYASEETLDLINHVIKITEQKTTLPCVQHSIKSCGEIDLKPIKNLITFNAEENIIYVNSILIECLNVLGYVEQQIYDLIQFTKNFVDIIPQDLIIHLPIESEKNIKFYYEKILPFFER